MVTPPALQLIPKSALLITLLGRRLDQGSGHRDPHEFLIFRQVKTFRLLPGARTEIAPPVLLITGKRVHLSRLYMIQIVQLRGSAW